VLLRSPAFSSLYVAGSFISCWIWQKRLAPPSSSEDGRHLQDCDERADEESGERAAKLAGHLKSSYWFRRFRSARAAVVADKRILGA
jgi:hypothetical protein